MVICENSPRNHHGQYASEQKALPTDITPRSLVTCFRSKSQTIWTIKIQNWHSEVEVREEIVHYGVFFEVHSFRLRELPVYTSALSDILNGQDWNQIYIV